MTFTSTTSMAGSRKNNNLSLNNYRKNMNSINSGGLLASMGSYYSRTSSPNLTNTVQSSPMRTSLKKRLFSTSPSKYSTLPYHTFANCNNANNLIFKTSLSMSNNLVDGFDAGSGSVVNGILSPDLELTFKRLKVMHNNNDNNGDKTKFDFNIVDNRNDNHKANITSNDLSLSSTNSSVTSFVSTQRQLLSSTSFNQTGNNHNLGQNKELNELAQDFHRLKTPFM